MNNYDLEERTFEFSKALIEQLRRIKPNLFNDNLIRQALKSGTSVGANYCEANGAESRNDFKHKIKIALKEACETQYWLSLIQVSHPEYAESLKECYQEIHELTLIFGKISSSCKH